jgi:PAS domain S-box-containing protein
LLSSYATERAAGLFLRLLAYTFACGVAAALVGVPQAALAYALLVGSDVLDCVVLGRHVQRLGERGQLRQAQRLASVTSACQGLALTICLALYYFSSTVTGNILIVFGLLGIAAVNAAIALPKSPMVAIARLMFYGSAPYVFLAIEALRSQSFAPLLAQEVGGLILALCMTYVFFAFTRFGVENFRIRQDLEEQRTERRAVTARLENQQADMQRLSLVARNANDSVVFTNKARRILWVNHAFTKVTGFSEEEALGQHIGELLAGDVTGLPEVHPIEEAVARGEGYRGDFENIRKDGKRIWVDVNLFPIVDETGGVDFFVSIERDVTEARQLAEDMARAREEAEHAARAKADFLANMSHEIRTPLTGVIGMADLLADTKLDAEQTRFTETIRGSSLALMAIINDILDLSKLDAGRMELNPVVFSPQDCVKDTMKLLSPAADDKGLAITYGAEAAIPAYVKADDGRIRQVLTNILGNAIKSTDTGGVDVQLSHKGEGAAARLICTLPDTGIGIEKSQQEQIFDHFTQAEADTTRKFGGTGLGLSITRHILDVMGGCISVKSEPGAGATFQFEFRYEAACPEELCQLSPAQGAGAAKIMPGLRVLVAEDNQTNRFLLEKYLKDQPIELSFAHDGREAVEAVERAVPDLIFMDMSMPRMTGIEATKAIREMAIAQPTIVALTAHAFDAEMQACLDAGMDAFLTKPLRKATLLNWIATYQQKGVMTGAA